MPLTAAIGKTLFFPSIRKPSDREVLLPHTDARATTATAGYRPTLRQRRGLDLPQLALCYLSRETCRV